jgi:hypothetical protein
LYIHFQEHDLRDIPSQYELTSLRRDVERANEAIKWLKETYIPALTEQAQRITFMELKKFVYIRKEVGWRGKGITYHVGIKQELWEDDKLFRQIYDWGDKETNKKFNGNERKAAFAHFETLRKKFNYPIIKEGLNKKEESR